MFQIFFISVIIDFKKGDWLGLAGLAWLGWLGLADFYEKKLTLHKHAQNGSSRIMTYAILREISSRIHCNRF